MVLLGSETILYHNPFKKKTCFYFQLDKAAKSDRKSPRKTVNKIPHLDLFGNIRDLRLFKIQSILANKVLLVSETGNANTRDNSSQQQVVIKALQKSSLVFKQRKTSMLPVNIPFMVRLLRYFETDELIYLVLEYIPHGPLFPIVGPFLERLVTNNSENLQVRKQPFLTISQSEDKVRYPYICEIVHEKFFWKPNLKSTCNSDKKLCFANNFCSK